MENTFNPNYPLQEHLSIDVDCEIIEFPSKDIEKCQHSKVAIDSKSNDLK